MKILFSYTLQSPKEVDKTLKTIKESHIPLKECRFSYCNDTTKQYLLNIKNSGIDDRNLIQSCGINANIDFPLNAMRLSKNKPDYLIIGLDYRTRITRFNEFYELLSSGTYNMSLKGKLNIFSDAFMQPYYKHVGNRINTRIIMCNGIQKPLLNEYVDTCAILDETFENNMRSENGYVDYTNIDVLENMNMTDNINIDLINTRDRTMFQYFFIAHLSDFVDE